MIREGTLIQEGRSLRPEPTVRSKTVRAKRDMDISKVLENAVKVSTPAWPLQNTVAVNPFWFLRSEPFEGVIQDVSRLMDSELLMPIQYYQGLFAEGKISKEGLKLAILEARKIWPELESDPDKFLELGAIEGLERIRTLSEFSDPSMNELMIADLGKYCAAYLDRQQAIALFPRSGSGFFSSWMDLQLEDQSLPALGLRHFSTDLSRLRGMSAIEAVDCVLSEMGIPEGSLRVDYLRRALSSILGWSSQFRYLEWQKSLGYPVSENASVAELLAVRLCYEFGYFKHLERVDAKALDLWKRALSQDYASPKLRSIQVRYVYQLALERTYQHQVGLALNRAIVNDAHRASALNDAHRASAVKDAHRASAQLVFCIDVRSEMIRRQIEAVDSSVKTLGFAGFFGAALAYRAKDQNQADYRLPVLLSPSFEVEEIGKTNHEGQGVGLSGVGGIFRGMRKYPLSSFVYVELFGAMYFQKILFKSIRRSLTRIFSAGEKALLPPRFKGREFSVRLGATERVDKAEFALRNMGLIEGFAPLVMVVGHGSDTTNNAFGSSLDCGACGGHAGDLNARVLVHLLNEKAVREGLSQRGISIPSDTRFVAAIHETVRDEVHVLDADQVPAEFREPLVQLQTTLRTAGALTRHERSSARSSEPAPDADIRALSWSEVRPEWGLAGNACFVVAPRSRTLGVNLASRSFLHDYDWRKDSAQGYQTLELIMTAPMVVTNWINMQYFSSTVAPQVYGSGNKVLHNLVNENGVLEGNGGDLRVGLPIQSVHDGKRFVHEPQRLSVFIEAPRGEIEKIIEKHEVVRDLVQNGWLHLLQIEPETLRVSKRMRNGEYQEVT